MQKPLVLGLSNATFGYGGRAVVSGVDLEVRAGDFLGIMGSNGGGKTTLLRGMLGLLKPMKGGVERHVDAIGYVPQRETLDPIFPLRVEEVVHMGAYGRLKGWRGLGRAERQLALDCLARVDLSDRARAPFSSLSGGQRQRALIARALMVRPRLLLLDEPTSGVDRETAAHILEVLLELNRGDGIAVMLVSHQMSLVRQAVQEVLLVAEGRVVRGPAARMLGPQDMTLHSGT
ncbi:MAG: metal ABC transporter ATP-binding protein [Planctomycetota bacterium]